MTGLEGNVTYNVEEELELAQDVHDEVEKLGGVILHTTDPRKSDFAISFMIVRTDYYNWKNKGPVLKVLKPELISGTLSAKPEIIISDYEVQFFREPTFYQTLYYRG
jgi:hypothetical protein